MEIRKLLCVGGSGACACRIEEFSVPGWEVLRAETPAAAQEMAGSNRALVGLACYDCCDLDSPQVDDLISATPEMEWIALLPQDCAADGQVCRMIHHHFFDYHTLPLDIDRLLLSVGHAYGMAMIRGRAALEREAPLDQGRLVGESAAMRELSVNIRKVANVEAPVLVTGESGTGKELAAISIHSYSSRANSQFVAVNCGALPPTLIQSELFGYEKGAFTGAAARKIGRIEAAAGGTIFLDEIGDLPLEMQVNLLRFLQEKTIERVGSTSPIEVDARVIAATHVDLERAVEQGRFREDLYYRLNVLPIKVPPLRERQGDIESLARFFFKKFDSEKRANILGFSRQALHAMNGHDWPGNVREMMNRIRRAMVMCEHRLIGPADLGLERRGTRRASHTLSEARLAAERDVIQGALARAHNNVSVAAKELDVSRVTLYRLMEKCGILPH